MPDETQLQPRAAGEQVVSSIRVEVIDGPDRGKQATSTETLSVGTAKDNALVVADFTVSRYHLEVSVGAKGIVVADLGSTNGTYVGAVRIDRAIVPPGTAVKLGGTIIRFDDAVRSTVHVDGRAPELAGMLARSPQMLPIPGSGNPEHVAQNIAAAGMTLSPDEISAIGKSL